MKLKRIENIDNESSGIYLTKHVDNAEWELLDWDSNNGCWYYVNLPIRKSAGLLSDPEIIYGPLP